ncbi:MAG: hypothetical protein KDK39_02585 [Leptospiraceae bacterium]|nr:hypothetical protein [Leptospiraceae bacterium]
MHQHYIHFITVVICVFLLSPGLNLQARDFQDDFSRDELTKDSAYIRFGHPEFHVAKDVLQLRHEAGKSEILSLLPVLGKKSEITFRARWTDGEAASLVVYSDWRYRTNGFYHRTLIWFHQQYVYFHYNGAKLIYSPLPIKKGEWINFRIQRIDRRLTFYANQKKLLEQELPFPNDTANDSSEKEYGGFALGSENFDKPYSLEIDDLKIKGDASPVQFHSQYKEYTVNDQKHRITVVYTTGNEKFARGQIDLSPEYLIFCQKLFDTAPMVSHSMIVEARGTAFLRAGFNNGGIITGGSPKDQNPFLNWHELAHNWGHLYAQRWTTEGSADFAGAMWHEQQSNSFTHALGLQTENVGEFIKTQQALYLDELEGNDVYKCRWKNSLIFIYLYRILGPDLFRKLHSEALMSKNPLKSKNLREIAERLSGRDLGPIFDGWVFQKNGTPGMSQAFSDSDGDGLGDLDEWVLGTNPLSRDSDKDGFGDLGEIIGGFNPLSASDPDLSKNELFILADGNGSDWDGVPAISEDAVDPNRPDDLKSIHMLHDATNHMLHIRVDYYRPIANPAKVTLTLDFSLAESYKSYYRMNINLGNTQISFYEQDNDQVKGADRAPIRYIPMQSGKTMVELSIPLQIMPKWDGKRLYVYSTSKTGSEVMDQQPFPLPEGHNMRKLPMRFWLPRRD